MFEKYTQIVFIAAWDIEKIIKSGKHGTEVLAAILSEMRTPKSDESPYSEYFATTSMTYEQMYPFFLFKEDATKTLKKKTVSVAVNKAIGSGGLVRLYEGTRGHASVYTFNVYVTALQYEEGNPNEGNSYQKEGVSYPEEADMLPFYPLLVTALKCEEGSLPYSSTLINNHPRAEGSKKSKHPKYERPTYDQYAAHCRERGYSVNDAEYFDLVKRDFTDYNGEPIKYWRAWIDKLHADDSSGTGEPRNRGTAQCPECGRSITVEIQQDGTYKGACQECRQDVIVSASQLVKRV